MTRRSRSFLSARAALPVLALAGWLSACDDGASPGPTRPKISAQVVAAPGYAVTDFATALPNNGFIGPIGLAFDPSGNLLVADPINGFLYKFGPAGGTASAATQLNVTPLDFAPTGLAFGKDGSLFLNRGFGDLVQLDPSTGTIIRTVVPAGNVPPLGFGGGAFGLATDPLSGDLFVSLGGGQGSVFRVSNFTTGRGTVTLYASTPAADGLAFGSDGTLFTTSPTATANAAVTEISATNSPTPGATTIIPIPFNADGIAVSAMPGTPFLYVNRNDGIITRIDLTTSPPTFTDIFTGGSRGDFAAVGPDGCLYATQTDRVIKVTNADATCLPPPLGPLIPTTRPPPLPLPTATFTFTASVEAGSAIQLSLMNAQVPGHPEVTSFTFTFDCGDGAGYGAFGSANTASCPTSVVGTRGVGGKVKDQAGDTQEYTGSVSITKAPQSIVFSSTPPNPASIGGSYLVGATGGGSGNPVVFSSLTLGVCGVSGSTVTLNAVGNCTVAADQAGNGAYLAASQATQTFSVVYGFSGFVAPVDNPPVMNVAKAGSAIPVKFSLHGNQGLNILAAGSPTSSTILCENSAPQDDVTGTVTAGGSSLSYDPSTDLYTYVWKTDKTWAGSCRELTVTLTDNSAHRATFGFTK